MKKFTLLLLSLLFAVSAVTLTACKEDHTHNYATELTAGETTHYYLCECGDKKDEVEHVFELTAGETTHYYLCECGDKKDEVEHVFDNDCDTDCVCGATREITHTPNDYGVCSCGVYVGTEIPVDSENDEYFRSGNITLKAGKNYFKITIAENSYADYCGVQYHGTYESIDKKTNIKSIVVYNASGNVIDLEGEEGNADAVGTVYYIVIDMINEVAGVNVIVQS